MPSEEDILQKLTQLQNQLFNWQQRVEFQSYIHMIFLLFVYFSSTNINASLL